MGYNQQEFVAQIPHLYTKRAGPLKVQIWKSNEYMCNWKNVLKKKQKSQFNSPFFSIWLSMLQLLLFWYFKLKLLIFFYYWYYMTYVRSNYPTRILWRKTINKNVMVFNFCWTKINGKSYNIKNQNENNK